jgi:hypothetical protein
MRKRRQNKGVGPDGGLYEKPSDIDNAHSSPYAPSATTVVNPHNSGYYSGHPETYAKVAPEMPPQELPVETKVAPQELPVGNRPHELP